MTILTISNLGGLSLARQLDPAVYPEPYKWNPAPLTKQQRSVEYLTRSIVHNPAKYRNNITNLAREVIEKYLGIPMKEADLSEFLELTRKVQKSDFYSIQSHLAEMISRRCELGWSSHGHSGVDVNLYAFGRKSNLLRGSHENTDIGDFIVNLLDLDLEAVTRELNDIETTEKTGGNVNFQVSHYHHHSNFKN